MISYYDREREVVRACSRYTGDGSCDRGIWSRGGRKKKNFPTTLRNNNNHTIIKRTR